MHQVFPDGANLVAMLQNATSNQLGKKFDLSTIQSEDKEIERKYRVTKGNLTLTWSRWLGKVASTFADESMASPKMLMTFAGVDLYYIFQGHDGQKYSFRYRFSGNVLAKIEVKWQLRKGNNETRGELKVKVDGTPPQTIRAFMAVVEAMATSCEHFIVHQSGNIWELQTKRGTVEVVVYKVGLLEQHSTEVFIEIEPRGYENPELAIAEINEMEKLLGLKRYRCEKSIAELFGPSPS